jgi:hypothetical protein
MKRRCPHTKRPVRALGLCGACYDRDLQRRNPEYAARVKARQEGYRAADPEGRSKVESERYARDGGHRAWVYHLRARYGLTLEGFERMRAEQGDACAVCYLPFSAQHKRPAVDHCHATGRVRGLLCAGCNAALGHVKDKPEVLRALAIYLESANRKK